MIFPLFDYGTILYHGFDIVRSGDDEDRLQLAQNMCFRFISNTKKYEHISPIINRFDMLLLNTFNLREFLILCFVHKLIYSVGPSYLSDIFVINSNNKGAGLNTKSLKINKVSRARDKHLMSHSIRNDISFKFRNE